MATITFEVDEKELWYQTFGSGYELNAVTHNWLMGVFFDEGTEWDKPGKAVIYYIPEDGDDTDSKYWGEDYAKHCHSKEITPEVLVEALNKIMRLGWYHCGYKVDTDWDNWDSCSGDLMFQMIGSYF